MRFFRLRDDVYIVGRWHLGEVMHGVDEPWLTNGRPFEASLPLTTEVHHRGKPIEYCDTSFNVPVVTRRLAQAMVAVAPNDIQRLPLHIDGHPGFEVINVLRILDCLDEQRSEFRKCPPDYFRQDHVGHYLSVPRLHVDASRIPTDVHIFRIARWEVALIVSEIMKDAMERAGCKGATFKDVT